MNFLYSQLLGISRPVAARVFTISAVSFRSSVSVAFRTKYGTWARTPKLNSTSGRMRSRRTVSITALQSASVRSFLTSLWVLDWA